MWVDPGASAQFHRFFFCFLIFVLLQGEVVIKIYSDQRHAVEETIYERSYNSYSAKREQTYSLAALTQRLVTMQVSHRNLVFLSSRILPLSVFAQKMNYTYIRVSLDDFLSSFSPSSCVLLFLLAPIGRARRFLPVHGWRLCQLLSLVPLSSISLAIIISFPLCLPRSHNHVNCVFADCVSCPKNPSISIVP